MRVLRLLMAAAALSTVAAQSAPDPHRPAPVVDTVPPAVPAGLRNAVLIVSKTSGWRHIEHIPHSNAVIADLVKAQRRRSFTTENAAVFNDRLLAHFAVVVLNSTSGDFLAPDQRAALQRFAGRGGGVVALHGAGGDSGYAWPWYRDRIIGAQFIGHPGGGDQFQSATIRVEAPRHPVMAGVTLPWTHVEEWYSFARSPRGPGVTILASVDEGSYRPGAKLAMGTDHPVIWVNGGERGRIVYSALGHRPDAYDDANYRRVIANAIRWVARR